MSKRPVCSFVTVGGFTINIAFANDLDYEYIKGRDHHISENLISAKIKEKEIYIIRNPDGSNIGWMRYGYFWDNIPFMNMIWIEEEFRDKGVGNKVVLFRRSK